MDNTQTYNNRFDYFYKMNESGQVKLMGISISIILVVSLSTVCAYFMIRAVRSDISRYTEVINSGVFFKIYSLKLRTNMDGNYWRVIYSGLQNTAFFYRYQSEMGSKYYLWSFLHCVHFLFISVFYTWILQFSC